MTPFVLFLGDPRAADPALVGPKAAHLSSLAASHPVPPGFCLTAEAYRRAEREGGIDPELSRAIVDAYTHLVGDASPPPPVAVRSSALDEDGPDASFASGVAAFAPTVEVLIAARTAQAITGASAIPNATAWVRTLIPASAQGRAFGLIGAGIGVAAAIGPPLGGLVTEAFGWHWIFALNLLVLGPAIALASWIVDPGRRSAGGRFDLAGAGLLLTALVSLALAATVWRAPGVPWPAAAALALTSFVAVGLLRRHVARSASPVVDLRLLRRPGFLAAGVSRGDADRDGWHGAARRRVDQLDVAGLPRPPGGGGQRHRPGGRARPGRRDWCSPRALRPRHRPGCHAGSSPLANLRSRPCSRPARRLRRAPPVRLRRLRKGGRMPRCRAPSP